MIRVFHDHKSDFIITRLNVHLDALKYKALYIDNFDIVEFRTVDINFS